jgi:hypothetical protein
MGLVNTIIYPNIAKGRTVELHVIMAKDYKIKLEIE